MGLSRGACAPGCEAARGILKPDQVDLHKVPRWLRRRIREKFPKIKTGYIAAFVDFLRENKLPYYWLDHWGVSVVQGERIFVSEPYENPDKIEEFFSFAKMLDLEYNINPNSWHFPGRTLRLELYPPEDS